jgi:hypothetical protein
VLILKKKKSVVNTVSHAYFALHETFHKVQNFEIIFFGTKVTAEAFLSISQNLKVTSLQGGTNEQNFEVVDKTFIFQGHLNFFGGLLVALLCSSRWSDQKCCKTECVALKTSFQTRPI